MQQYSKALLYADSSLQVNSNLINYNSLSPSAAAPFVQFNTEVIFAATNAGDARFSVNNLLVDSLLYQSYQTDDLRKTLFFKNLSPQPGYGFKGNYDGNTYGQLFSGLAVDEMFLIKAECQARVGTHTSALQTLNALLITRWRTGTFVPFTAATNQQALDIILVERRKELVGRSLRWQDLRRYNLNPATAITLKRLVNGTVYLLPPRHPNYTFYIPQLVIQESGIQQNTRQ
ncbi:MAG: RagB/SusD family nutrient uptake outer membrane protein [Sphingobacteriales bacterium]|nr:MAG: RagB/SusD family nutrient uptake outer membrane protein [Sphingobacteriales bacterium]